MATITPVQSIELLDSYRMTVNKESKARRVERNGRSYLVAPVTLITHGVHSGSRGPVYYPDTMLDSHAQLWNDCPIVVNHPQNSNGEFISINDTMTTNGQGGYEIIGRLYKSGHKNGKTQGESWFDEELTKKFSVEVYNNLLNGTPIEVSTGMIAQAEKKEGDFNGKKYDYVVMSYKRDHLAVLPNEKGACSVADGCGVFNSRQNSTTTNSLENMDDAQYPAPFIWERLSSLIGFPILNTIRKLKNGKYRLYSGSGKNLGTFDTLDAAKKHEKEVKMFKHMDSNKSMNTTMNKSMLVNGQPSHDEIRHELCEQLEARYNPPVTGPGTQPPMEYIYVVEVFDKYVIFYARDSLWKLKYTTDLRSSGSDRVKLSDEQPEEVERDITYKVVSNSTTVSKSVIPSNDTQDVQDVAVQSLSGVLSNINNSNEGQNVMNKTQLIDWIVVNCECWKGEKDKDILNTLTETKLSEIKAGVEKSKSASPIATSPVPVAQPVTQTVNNQAPVILTPEQLAVLNTMIANQNQERADLIATIVANAGGDDANKVRMTQQYQSDPIEKLRDLVMLLNKGRVQNGSHYGVGTDNQQYNRPYYMGGSAINNRLQMTKEEKQECLDLPDPWAGIANTGAPSSASVTATIERVGKS